MKRPTPSAIKLRELAALAVFAALMIALKEVLAFLDEHAIPYEYHEHERTASIDACLQMSFITEDVTICRNIFLCNERRTNYFLLLLRPLTPFRTSVVSKLLGSSRLSFGPVETMEEKMHLTSGSVSPLGLLFDREHTIRLAYDEAVCSTPRIAFHPCDNSATVIFEQDIFWQQVIPALEIAPVCIRLSEND